MKFRTKATAVLVVGAIGAGMGYENPGEGNPLGIVNCGTNDTITVTQTHPGEVAINSDNTRRARIAFTRPTVWGQPLRDFGPAVLSERSTSVVTHKPAEGQILFELRDQRSSELFGVVEVSPAGEGAFTARCSKKEM